MQSDKFDIVLIAAGLSSRMGGVQKVLHTIGGHTLLYYSLTSALLSGDAVLVTGHNSKEVEKEAHRIRDSRDFKNNLTIVYNRDYEKGQYSSTICGIEALNGKQNFALSLGDMPFIRQSDYTNLNAELKNFDALRPFIDESPAHPVFFKSDMREFFMNHKDEKSVRNLLENYKNVLKIKNLEYTENKKIAVDFDYETDFSRWSAVDWT